MRDTLEFARELIRRPSVTPDDAGCQELIADRLAAAGFTIENLPFGDVKNLWARRGTSAPVFCFAGHTDVVPIGPREDWLSDPFEPETRDGLLYGRGAADMKSSLAAMVNAAAEFVGNHPDHQGSIAFLITSDEEGRARDGTKSVIEELDRRGEKIDWCVVGEPSCTKRLGDTMRIGRRGSLSGILTVHGHQGHVAYPQLADNPIEKFAPVLAELYSSKLDDGNEFFPASSFQVVHIDSGTGAPNVTPGELRARFNFRYSTEWTHEEIERHIEGLFARHDLRYTLKWHLSGEPFLSKVDQFVLRTQSAVETVTGVEPELSTGGGTSDGRFISPSGAQVVEFGAINTSIHKVNEHIIEADVETLREVYLETLERNMLNPSDG